MHSRIYQISEKPIDKDDYVTEDDYYESFCGSHADYVDSNTDRNEDIEWVIGCLGDSVSYDEKEQSFTIVNKAKYFEKSFNAFKELLEKLENTTLEEFSGVAGIDTQRTFESNMYMLKTTYEDEYAFYIDDRGEYFGIASLDYFMRRVETGKKFYIGATIDYHF